MTAPYWAIDLYYALSGIRRATPDDSAIARQAEAARQAECSRIYDYYAGLLDGPNGPAMEAEPTHPAPRSSEGGL